MLERLRALRAARAAARGADVGRRRPLPARAGGGGDRLRRRGGDVPAAARRDRGARPASTGARWAPWRASASCARRSRGTHLQVARAVSARTRLRRGGRATCSPSCGRSLVTPARFTRALRGWAAAARRRRTPRSSPRSTRPTTAGWRASAAATRRATRAPRWTRCASGPAAWGARPVFLYGFDDLDAAAARRGRDARGPRRRGGLGRAALRARPRRVRRARRDGRAAEAARRPPRRARRPLGALRGPGAARAAPPRAAAVRGRRRAVLAQRRRAAAGGRRRARGGRAGRPPRCSS